MPVVFNPPIPPQENPQSETRFNVYDIRFGDGYVASFAEGMNDKIEEWPLAWKGTSSEILPIRDFFDSHKGYISFYWTPPYGVQGLYRVKSYSFNPEAAGNMTLTATLIQVFAP